MIVEYSLQFFLAVDFWVKLWAVSLLLVCRFTWKRTDFQLLAAVAQNIFAEASRWLMRHQNHGMRLNTPIGKFRAFVCMVLIVFINVFAAKNIPSAFQMDYHQNDASTLMSVKTGATNGGSSASNSVITAKYTGSACISTFDRESLPVEEQGLFVFTAPPSMTVLPEAMKSWDVALRGKGRLIVFTNDPGTRQLMTKNDIPTMCVEHVDEGLPRLDKMFERMEKSQPDGIVAYVNSDIEVQDFDPLHEFLLSMNGLQLEILRPSQIYMEFEPTGRMSKYWFTTLTRQDISEDGRTSTHSIGGYDFWAWNLHPGGIPLLPFDMPPFRFPLAIYDNWLLDVINQVAQRNVIDATNVSPIYHRDHKTKSQGWYQLLKKGVSGVYINRYLGFNEPSKSLPPNHEYAHVKHRWQFGTTNEAPYYVMRNGSQAETRLLKRRYWSDLPESELSDLGCLQFKLACTRTEFIETKTEKQQLSVSSIPYTPSSANRKISSFEESATEMWRYTLQEQLKVHANPEGYILVTAVNYVYRDHLMNWKCSLERVGMGDHFLVGALDEEMYEWGLLQGLPIFKATAQADAKKAGNNVYGSDDFKLVTKLKSRVVLEVLNAGYHAIWSDVDITWFVHPFDALATYMNNSTGIAIQSNAPYVANPEVPAVPHSSVEPVTTDDPTGYRRLNSGLYIATNTLLVRSAFEEIIDDAGRSNRTEQPSFDKILCERFPSERKYESCIYRPDNQWKRAAPPDSELLIQSFDRFSFPNGAILVGDTNENVYTLGRELFEKETGGVPLYSAHNNWIKGETSKKTRQKESGWWFTDSAHSCTYATK